MSVAISAPASPYKGLAPFEDSDVDAMLFFGREAESAVIAANLIASRITVLYGPSGVGKSSVLRAGVAHRLRQEREAAVIVFASWAGDPVAALIEAAEGSGDSLPDALADAADRAGGDLYLILDQFEECFLYHKGGGAFAAQLAQVLRRGGLRVNVLIGMREDALARLDALKASIPNLLTNRLRLERLDRRAATSAIIGPVDRYNELVPPEERVEIEPELELAVLDQVTAGRVELATAGRGVPLSSRDEDRIEAPYLQLVLSRLWDVERSRDSRVLHLATLAELGGAEHIVEDHLERAMAELTPREKGAAAAMYNFLVTPSGTKIAHGIRDLAGYAAVDEDEAGGVLRRLTAERIIRASSENGPSSTRYEIFHDVLADAVVAWRTRYEGERALEAARVEHHRRQRRLLAIFAAALVALAVMAAIAIYAFDQRAEAQHQASVAKEQQVKAERSEVKTKKALAAEATAKRKAQKNYARAQRNEQKYKQAAAHARHETDRANTALVSESRARQRADASATEAQRETRRANQQTKIARRETHRKALAEAAALRQRNIGSAQKLEADARTKLTEDPAASVQASLRAIQAYRKARIPRPVSVENTLREGLVLLRVRAILPGRGAVSIVRFSPDGKLVFVGGRGGARIYDLAHHLSVRRLLTAVNIDDAAFSPDGSLLVAAGSGKDHAAHIWDAHTGVELERLQHDGSVLSVAFSPNGQLIATGSADGTARLWSVAGGLQLASFKHERGGPGGRGHDVIHVEFSPDGSQFLTVGGNRFVRVFDVASRSEAFSLNNTVLVNVARFSHNGKWIATAGADESVRLWDAETAAAGPSFAGTGRITDLAFSPDDTLIATAGTNDTIARVWNIAQRNSTAIITIHRSGVQAVTFTRDGTSVVTAGRDGNAYILGANAGFVEATFAGHKGPLAGVTVSPSGDLIATWSDDGTARLWDATALRTVAPEIASHEEAPVGALGPVVGFSRDGRHMLSAGFDGTVRIWGPGARSLTLHQDGGVNSAAFSADSARVIAGGAGKTARVWRVADGRLLAVLEHGAAVTSARLTSNGRFAVTAGRDGRTVVWNVSTQSVVREYQLSGPINDVELSRDGARIAAASADGTAAVFGVTRSSELVLRGHSDEVTAVAFSPDGKHVATASDDSTARIWNARTGEFVELLGHTSGVTALAFNSDGSRLATASADTSVRVWNTRTGAQVALLLIHSGGVMDVAFSSDGRWLASAGPLAAGIWETVKKGAWPASPQWLVRGVGLRRLDHVGFSPRGWRLLTGWRSGSVRLYNCRQCGGVPQLRAIAVARLHEIIRAKP